MSSGYRTSVVGLIDILGVSEALTDPDRAGRYSEAVAAILRPMIGDKGEDCFVLPHIEDARKVEVFLTPGTTKISFFSDTIVVSAPIDEAGSEKEHCKAILACLEAIKGLQRSLLLLGLRSRGGLAKGGLIHSGELLVGDGLKRAHDIERLTAKTPRAVIDPPLIEDLRTMVREHFPIYRNRVAHTIRRDDDGAYFVDYLAFCPSNGFCSSKRQLDLILERTKADLEARPDVPWVPKLEWLIRYVEASAAERQSDRIDPCEHVDVDFARIYPRTNETLKTFVESEAELVRRLQIDEAAATTLRRDFWLWPLGWRTVMTPPERTRLEAELANELAEGHILKDRSVEILGRFEYLDDVLFRLDDGSIAEVHLTWHVERCPDWPRVSLHPTFNDWATNWRRRNPLRKRGAARPAEVGRYA
jgi:hypothetical protein